MKKENTKSTSLKEWGWQLVNCCGEMKWSIFHFNEDGSFDDYRALCGAEQNPAEYVKHHLKEWGFLPL